MQEADVVNQKGLSIMLSLMYKAKLNSLKPPRKYCATGSCSNHRLLIRSVGDLLNRWGRSNVAVRDVDTLVGKTHVFGKG